MINTDYINEDHIEAAKVYIRTLADSEKLCSKTVVHMTGIGGETCTPEMLEAIISKKWLHGGVSISNNLLSCTCHLHKLSNRRIAVMLFCRSSIVIATICRPIILVLTVTYYHLGCPTGLFFVLMERLTTLRGILWITSQTKLKWCLELLKSISSKIRYFSLV